MPTRDPATTSRRKPNGWNPWHAPLPTVAVPAQNQIDGMMRLHLVENIGCMGKQQRKPMVCTRRETSQVSPVKRRIIDTDDHQLSPCHRDDYTPVHQQCDLVPIGHFGILCHRHAAVMIMVPQSHICRRDVPKAAKKSEQMRQSFWYIEQVPRDHNPVRLKITNDMDEAIMVRTIPVDMQVGEMDEAAAGKQPMQLGMSGHFIVSKAKFPVRDQAKQPVEGMANGMTDGSSYEIGP